MTRFHYGFLVLSLLGLFIAVRGDAQEPEAPAPEPADTSAVVWWEPGDSLVTAARKRWHDHGTGNKGFEILLNVLARGARRELESTGTFTARGAYLDSSLKLVMARSLEGEIEHLGDQLDRLVFMLHYMVEQKSAHSIAFIFDSRGTAFEGLFGVSMVAILEDASGDARRYILPFNPNGRKIKVGEERVEKSEPVMFSAAMERAPKLPEKVEWPPLPASGFISGRVATTADVEQGRAHFSLEKVTESAPLNIDIPQYAYYKDEEGRLVPGIVLQGEQALGIQSVAFRPLDPKQEVMVVLLESLVLLGQAPPPK